ncbi:hypothetical protein BKA70DRAFT_1431268 [Coprinopsis sp. MPI-PUGE-AT-0042]|nr:hypothetical protein BKA70DRAFT_1431268 [Coprinopsis sp. MPI-PUGE-AT-0042]
MRNYANQTSDAEEVFLDSDGLNRGVIDGSGPASSVTEEGGPARGDIDEGGPTGGVIEEDGPARGDIDEGGLGRGVIDGSGVIGESGPAHNTIDQDGPASGATDEGGPVGSPPGPPHSPTPLDDDLNLNITNFYSARLSEPLTNERSHDLTQANVGALPQYARFGRLVGWVRVQAPFEEAHGRYRIDHDRSQYPFRRTLNFGGGPSGDQSTGEGPSHHQPFSQQSPPPQPFSEPSIYSQSSFAHEEPQPPFAHEEPPRQPREPPLAIVHNLCNRCRSCECRRIGGRVAAAAPIPSPPLSYKSSSHSSISRMRSSSGCPSFGRDLQGSNLPSLPSEDYRSVGDDLPDLGDFTLLVQDFVRQAAAILAGLRAIPHTDLEHHTCEFWRCIGISCRNPRRRCPLTSILPFLRHFVSVDLSQDILAFARDEDSTGFHEQAELAMSSLILNVTEEFRTPEPSPETSSAAVQTEAQEDTSDQTQAAANQDASAPPQPPADDDDDMYL